MKKLVKFFKKIFIVLKKIQKHLKYAIFLVHLYPDTYFWLKQEQKFKIILYTFCENVHMHITCFEKLYKRSYFKIYLKKEKLQFRIFKYVFLWSTFLFMTSETIRHINQKLYKQYKVEKGEKMYFIFACNSLMSP